MIANRRWRPFVALWLALAAALVISNSRFYFHDEHWEVGDAAANGLQIRQAKEFRELHGNYSRFGFHHPGPGFFYAYAAGEAVFYDLLKIVPAPHNAHVLIGALIQTGFLAWTLSILARRFPHPLLVPLVLVFAALHFGAVNYNIPHSMYESIWPPNVLLFPFLCFLVACASIAAGSLDEILPAMVAGCLLVHGHVAQPLFVFPMFVLSCVGFAVGCRTAGKSLVDSLRGARRRLAFAAVVLVVFLVPLAIDASRGESSNLARIVRQLSDSAVERKTILQSLNYLGNLACYVPDPEKFCDRLSSESLSYARDRWYVVAGWLLLIGTLAFEFRRHSGDRLFHRWLHVYFGVGLLLMLRWGVMQSGPMFAFNSHFAFGLLFVPMILLAVAISRRVGNQTARRIAPFGLLAAVPLLAASSYDWKVWPPTSPGPVFQELAPVARSEPHRTKFLRFPGHEWPWAVGTALALRRLGMDFRVERHFGFMFGEKKTAALAAVLRSNEMRVWHIGAEPTGRTGFRLGGGPYVATLPPPLNPAGTEIRFDGDAPNASDFAVTGWDVTPGPFSFSTAKTAVLYFQPLKATRDVEMTVSVFPATFPDLPAQRMIVSLERERLHEARASEEIEVKVIIPAVFWNRGRTATVVFDFPDSASPRDLGVSGDERRLGFGFRSISFRELPPVP